MDDKICTMFRSFIKKRYQIRSEILIRLSKHIDDLNRESIIHHNIRNRYAGDLSSCIMKLNNAYNEIIKLYKKLDNDIDSEYQNFDPDHDQELFDLIMTYNDISSERNDPKRKIMSFFDEVDDMIKSLMSKVGSEKIEDAIQLVAGHLYRKILNIDRDVDDLTDIVKRGRNNMDLISLMKNMHNSMGLFDLLNDTFHPVDIFFRNGYNRDSILIKRYSYKKNVPSSEESLRFKYEVLLENCYKITIKTKIPNFAIVVIGYFDYDTVNSVVATSQLCNPFVYQKKKKLVEYVEKNVMINGNYKDLYLTNLTLGEILAYKGDDLVTKMMSDYEIYTRSCNIKFKSTIEEFLKANLTKKYNMLKCLLLGPKSSIKHGAMLYGMAKDQNRDSKNNRSCVADILFRNLSHSQQSRLRNSGHYVKQEMDRIKKMTADDMDLKQQCIMNNNMTDQVKRAALVRLEEMKSNGSEYQKNHTYVNTLINYPWITDNYSDIFTRMNGDITKIKKMIDKMKVDFNKKVFGQEEFKNTIIDLVGKWASNPESMGKAIGLCGPPGVGKTLIASALGEILGIPYEEIHVGGLEDGSVLNGHSFTYSGAQPGLIVTKMVAAGEPRCIMFFDELDKSSSKHGINEIFNVLIHATDPNTNKKFSDKFFSDVTFDLSKVIFVFSFNDASKIDRILRDRMEIIDVTAYSVNDKLTITQDYLIPELLKGIAIENGAITLTNKTIEHIIAKYTREAGVRGLRNTLEKCFLKMNIDRIYSRGPFKKRTAFSAKKAIKLTKQHILKYLGKPKLEVEAIHDIDMVGVINGLYATDRGYGGIIPILIYRALKDNKNFSLELTGKQGKTMKESVSFAWTIAKNCLLDNIVKDFYRSDPGGLHIHTPDGATPKDGPSAGSAFTTAFISRITGYKIKRKVAMTGEINIGGAVSAIGGLEHKLNGAKEAGVKFVFVCKKNLDDVKKIKKANPELFNLINPNEDPDVEKVLSLLCKKKNSNSGDFKVMVIETIYDIIPYALIDPEYVNEHYVNGEYDLYSTTCDISKFMTDKSQSDELIDNQGSELDNDDVVVCTDESDDVEDIDDDNNDNNDNEGENENENNSDDEKDQIDENSEDNDSDGDDTENE